MKAYATQEVWLVYRMRFGYFDLGTYVHRQTDPPRQRVAQGRSTLKIMDCGC
jgi:hypothetical protein